MGIKLSHIGEVLVSDMLSHLSARGDLQRVSCAATGTSLASELDTAAPQFLADKATLKISSAGRTYSCDGAQTVDILCAGQERAVAMEAKLGGTLMSFTNFPKRFCGEVKVSAHADPRVNGNMVGILDRLPPFSDSEIFATVDDRIWPISTHWWLVVRRRVWRSWANRSPVRLARILVFDDLAQIYGGPREFDDLVRQVVGNDFASHWKVEFKE